MSNSRTADKFVIRLPDGMREQLAARAKQGHVSMNTLCIQALEQLLDGVCTVEVSAEVIESHIDRLMTHLQQAREVAK